MTRSVGADLAVGAAVFGLMLVFAGIVQGVAWLTARRLGRRARACSCVTTAVPETARSLGLVVAGNVAATGMLCLVLSVVPIALGGESTLLGSWARRERQRAIDRLCLAAMELGADGVACVRVVSARIGRRGRYKLAVLASGDAYRG